jgi:hypothetical protein
MAIEVSPQIASLRPSAVELGVKVIRADGTVVDLGIVSAKYRNPFRQLWFWLQWPMRRWKAFQANRRAT